MKNKYKEQMSKICVDDEMKKRVMSKLRQSQEEKKEKGFIFKGQAIYKYSSVAAACCALAVTYAITTNFPELMNNEEKTSKQIIYDNGSEEENSSSDREVKDTEETGNNESSIVEYNEKDNNKIEENNLNIRANNKNNISATESKQHNDNTSSIELNNSSAKSEQNVEINDADSIKERGNVSSISVEDSEAETKNSIIIREENEQGWPDEAEDNESAGRRIVSYNDEESKHTDYLFQQGIPDLSDIGFYINYVNQISKDEIEIMYLSDKETELWIKICNGREDNAAYKQDNNYIVHKKNDKNYYIWSSGKIESALLANIISQI